jgi:hypothetical protein
MVGPFRYEGCKARRVPGYQEFADVKAGNVLKGCCLTNI